nr:hypothetical protein [Micromonospora sp. DSM 115978]
MRAGRSGAPGRLAADSRTAFRRPFGTDAEHPLGAQCEAELDPCLTRAAESLADAAAAVSQLEQWPSRQLSIGKETMTVQRAHLEAAELSRRVNEETARGFTHHFRPGAVWKYTANLLLFVDLLAIVVIFSEILNVDFTAPTAAPGETLAAFVLPIVLLVAQFWLSAGTGRRYNERREAAGSDAREEAERQGRRWAAVLALVTVLPLTIFLITRLLQISDEANLGL